MRERRIPGVQVAVVKDGKIVLSKSFGTVTNKTIFPIYSCTKAFTGVAIMQLVEDEKVELSAPVSRYLDGLPPAWQQITIRQLLTHVSGLPNILNLLDPKTFGMPGRFPEEFIDELAGYYKPEIAASDPVTALRIKLRQRGYEHALEVYQELKRKDPQFQPRENDLNDWAYRMMNGGGKPKEALEIFKLNVFLYPNSANVYDSVAEAYAVNGNRELAIKNYKRSLELDPKNTNAARQLKKLTPE